MEIKPYLPFRSIHLPNRMHLICLHVFMYWMISLDHKNGYLHKYDGVDNTRSYILAIHYIPNVVMADRHV